MDVSDGTRKSLIAVFEAHEALIDRLISENAKLRELIRDIYVQYDGTLDWVEIERRMSELGIEA